MKLSGVSKNVVLFCNILVILSYILFYEIHKWGNRSDEIIRVLVETQEDDYNYWQIRNDLISLN